MYAYACGMETIAVAIGLVGAAIVLLAYFMLAAGRLKSDGYLYPLCNLLGSAGILISLGWQWNLASFIINTAWVVISLVGMARIHLARKVA